MCVVSAVFDDWNRTVPGRYPNTFPATSTNPADLPHPFQPVQDALRECVVCGQGREHFIHSMFEPTPTPAPTVSPEDFDALKKEVEELKILILAAKRFDESTGQPDCEMDEKIELLRQIAEMVGVDLEEVFG